MGCNLFYLLVSHAIKVVHLKYLLTTVSTYIVLSHLVKVEEGLSSKVVKGTVFMYFYQVQIGISIKLYAIQLLSLLKD